MNAKELTDLLIENNFNFLTGVPDSIFKHWLLYIEQNRKIKHIICNNEGEACAIGAGYHLGTGKIPIIYLQNSGLGNCINPITSLLDSYIYSIPALFFITWRGQPGKPDEPQHQRMGEVLLNQLELLDIPYAHAVMDPQQMGNTLAATRQSLKSRQCPHAIIFKDSLTAYNTSDTSKDTINNMDEANHLLTREQVISLIIENLPEETIFVSTTGKTSREFFELRQKQGKQFCCDFMTVGSMGCASSIALGLALARPERLVVVLDGDGACLMRLEAMATIGHYKPKNLLHIIINNGTYESTGNQKTLADTVDFGKVALACQYPIATRATTKNALLKDLKLNNKLKLLEIMTNTKSRTDLGRPSTTPQENKEVFMNVLRVCNDIPEDSSCL